MASIVIKNWDNKNWLSSRQYIKSLNNFILRQSKLNVSSEILDIGCGRGKILGSLSSKLKLKNKPLGIDLINHKDKDKRIKFKKINALNFFFNNKKKFDLIIIKQTIHLFQLSEIKKILRLSKKNLTSRGKIFIFSLDINKNEIPTFKLMKNKLAKSLIRDKKIFNLIIKSNTIVIKKKFFYKVKITKKKYLNMIKNRYISTLLTFTNKELLEGLNELNLKYKKNMMFKDKLICLIL